MTAYLIIFNFLCAAKSCDTCESRSSRSQHTVASVATLIHHVSQVWRIWWIFQKKIQNLIRASPCTCTECRTKGNEWEKRNWENLIEFRSFIFSSSVVAHDAFPSEYRCLWSSGMPCTLLESSCRKWGELGCSVFCVVCSIRVYKNLYLENWFSKRI